MARFNEKKYEKLQKEYEEVLNEIEEIRKENERFTELLKETPTEEVMDAVDEHKKRFDKAMARYNKVVAALEKMEELKMIAPF